MNVLSRIIPSNIGFPLPLRYFGSATLAFLLVLITLSDCRANSNAGGLQSPPDLAALSFEELLQVEVDTVYGASKFKQSTSEAPSSVSIVTADEIKKFGYRNLADVLRSQRGFFVTYDRNYAYVGIRGVDRAGGYNTRLLVLVDGHRTNENIYDTAFIGNDFILDLDLIERIEIIRGPGSSLYGDNAFFAVINIITRHNRSLQGVEISGEAGSLDTYKGRLSYGKSFGNETALSLSGSILDSKGNSSLFFPEFNDPSTNNGIARNLDFERYYNLFGTVSYRDLTLQGAYVSRTKGIPTAAFDAVFNDPRLQSVDNRGYLDLKYNHGFSGGWTGMARLFYDDYYYHQDNPVAGASPEDAPILNRDSAINKWLGTELQVSRTFFEQHRVIMGFEYQKNLIQKFDNHDVAPFKSHLDVDRPTWRLAPYIQDEYTILPGLILNAGVRYDHFSTFGGTVNPRAALIYSPWEGTTFKTIYGEAFRSPNTYEFNYGVPEYGLKGNTALRPEKTRGLELVWEQMLGEHFLTTLDGFYNKISDMIVQETDPADGLLVFRNSAEVTVQGVEAEVEGKWENGIRGRASYTFQDARNDLRGGILNDSPQHMVKFNLTVPVYEDRLFSGVEVQYMSSRKTLAGSRAGAFVITNLTLFSQKILKGLELSGSIYNLFDEKYSDPGSGEHRQDVINQDGRTFRIKLAYKF